VTTKPKKNVLTLNLRLHKKNTSTFRAHTFNLWFDTLTSDIKPQTWHSDQKLNRVTRDSNLRLDTMTLDLTNWLKIQTLNLWTSTSHLWLETFDLIERNKGQGKWSKGHCCLEGVWNISSYQKKSWSNLGSCYLNLGSIRWKATQGWWSSIWCSTKGIWF
jgi:hypothetical protein